MSLIQASADADPRELVGYLRRAPLGWRLITIVVHFADGWRPALWCLRGQHLVPVGRA